MKLWTLKKNCAKECATTVKYFALLLQLSLVKLDYSAKPMHIYVTTLSFWANIFKRNAKYEKSYAYDITFNPPKT